MEKNLKWFEEIDATFEPTFYTNVFVQKIVEIMIRDSIVSFLRVKEDESFLKIIDFKTESWKISNKNKTRLVIILSFLSMLM